MSQIPCYVQYIKSKNDTFTGYTNVQAKGINFHLSFFEALCVEIEHLSSGKP